MSFNNTSESKERGIATTTIKVAAKWMKKNSSKIANVLETDVNILLDGQITTTDQSEIVKQLAKINEQLTIKNRRYKKIITQIRNI